MRHRAAKAASSSAPISAKDTTKPKHGTNKSRRVLAGLAGLAALLVVCNAALTVPKRDACEVANEARTKLNLYEVGKKPLPKIIHQMWRNADVPVEFAAYRAGFLKLFPSHEHVLWTDETMRELIKNHYAFFLPIYDAYPYPIQRADAARAFILHFYGGLYADLDYEPHSYELWNGLSATNPSLIESPYRYNELVQNSLMASPKGHDFWNTTIDMLVERAKTHPDILSSTGPILLQDAMLRYSASNKGVVYVLPCENYHRIPLGEAGVNSPAIAKFFRELVSRSYLVKKCGDWRDLNCNFGLHHNSVSWSPMSGLNTGKGAFM